MDIVKDLIAPVLTPEPATRKIVTAEDEVGNDSWETYHRLKQQHAARPEARTDW